MDKERRSRLKSVVGRARRVVEDDVRVQLRRLGIDENEIKPVERLPHLSDADKELRAKVVEAIEKEKAGDISYGEAFDRYVRHVGFTCVNRIAALRAMEVRNLINEMVIRRDVYGGRSRREYELAERERISDPYELLKAGLVEAFNEVSTEIKVLFDVNSEYSLVFLGHKALLELIRLLSEEVPEEDWKEDDIVGWIYQYYNEEARAEFKRAKRKPKADDIPVINQFYTPRWVVRVLVDNTLSRLWLEMNGRCPKLGDSIKRTKEQLENPSGDKVDDFCSYLVPLNQEPPPREKKRVKEIKILDPACGSGHFLVYAFDVLSRMYREDEPDTPVEEIPRLILENNLFGIDIDLRAVQLAALSLYLKAKSYNPRLKITKMNLVCADARITDGKVRKVFLERFAGDPELQRIFAKIFEDLEYTYEVGSLLKVREPFERLFERRKREGDMQAVLLPRIEGQTAISEGGKLEGQAKLDLKVVEDRKVSQVIAVPREVALEQMLNALIEFEREALEKRDMGTLLFATEAEKSVGLMGLLSEKYDVVLMNPPYGDMSLRAKKYLESHFPRTHYNLYAAFIEQAVDLAQINGFVGMLTSWTFMFLRSFSKIRTEILYNISAPELLLEFGIGILDGSTVRTAATVLRRISEAKSFKRLDCCFCNLASVSRDGKTDSFHASLQKYISKGESANWYLANFREFINTPRMAYAYWAPSNVLELFAKYPPLDRDVAKRQASPKIADVKQGLATADNDRFLRYFWECQVHKLGRSNKWVPLAKSEEYSNFYMSMYHVINWENNGEEIKDFEKSVIRGEHLYFREGLTWTAVTQTNLGRRHSYLPPNCIFEVAAQGIFPKFSSTLWTMLSLLNSALVHFLMVCQQLERHWHVGYMAAIPWSTKAQKSNSLGSYAHEAHDLVREWDTGNEISPIFIKPWLLQVLKSFDERERPLTGHPFAKTFCWSDWGSLNQIRSIIGNKEMEIRDLAILAIKREEQKKKRLQELLNQIDTEVYNLYEISEEDRKIIERELPLRAGEVPLLEEQEEIEGALEEGRIEAVLNEEERVKDHVARLVSFYVKGTLESDPDGIMPLHELVQQVRKKLAHDFGEDQIDAKEKEIQKILGRNLEEWVVTGYFDFHVNLYKRRPIFWHLTSSNFSTIRGSQGAINIFLHCHKLDRDTIPKILTNYLKPELETTKWKTERLKRELQQARDQGNRTKERELSDQLENAVSLLEELEGFQKALETVHNPRPDKTKLPKNPTWVQQKIAEVRDNGYNPVIDYGVRVNIEPLKEAGLLHKAAQRVK